MTQRLVFVDYKKAIALIFVISIHSLGYIGFYTELWFELWMGMG